MNKKTDASRVAFEEWVRSDASPINTGVPWDDEIMEAMWAAWLASRNEIKPDTYAVINKGGDVEYSAGWPEACHDHIKDMQIEHGRGGDWRVRGIKILDPK